MIDIVEWIDRWAGPGQVWYVKRLSHNDTQKTRGHQAGPYIPKELLFRLFPNLNQPTQKNPRIEFSLYIDSHADHRRVQAIWYNNKLNTSGGTRNETRLTGFGGSESAFLDPDSAGSIAVFVFCLGSSQTETHCHAWICRHGIEEDIVEDYVGVLLPKRAIVWPSHHPSMSGVLPQPTTLAQRCYLGPEEMPPSWLKHYPSTREVVGKTVELTSVISGLPPDNRILRRVECEFELFRSVEEFHELPVIVGGFQNLESFLDRAKSVTQRRRVRAGLSLELHAREIFLEEGLVEGRDFEYQAYSEGRKRPDFLFPSGTAYANDAYPQQSLAMLAVKRTTKDRWRQILNEADRVTRKHLFTIQDTISETQIREMINANVGLVVPRSMIDAYPPSFRDGLLTLEDFISHVRVLQGPK